MVKSKQADLHSPHELNIECDDPWNRLNINLDHLKANYQVLKNRFSEGSFFYSVVKSDAYGHGIEKIAQTLAQAGCRHFAVESPGEGIALRNEKIEGEILLLNPIPEWMSEMAVRHDMSVSVIHPSILQPLEDAACKMDKLCKVHLNLNVGLHRLGIAPSRLIRVAREAVSKPHVQFEGLFAQPQGPDNALNEYRILKENYQKLVSKGLKPNYLHFANSTVFLSHPETMSDGARLGILLYGVLPPEQSNTGRPLNSLKPVMELTSELVQIRELDRGSRIGYRTQKRTKRDSLIGTIPIGYSHGFNREVIKKGQVIVRGRKVPFIGNISMNASTIDITDVPMAMIGDRVTIIGEQGVEAIGINDLAQSSGTIAAELMMLFGRGISRNYISGDNIPSITTTIRQKMRQDIHIDYYQSLKELPEQIDFYDIVSFLKDHLAPFDDSEETINSALDYAFSSHSHGGGFVLLAVMNKDIIAAAVCVQMDKVEFVPENLLVYLCVHRGHRRRGLGSSILRKVIDYTHGNLKLHLDKSNPALEFLEKHGFKEQYAEMRLIKRWGE
jgi:alanine racemase